MSESNESRVVELHKDNVPLKTISEKTGLPISRIYYILGQAGIILKGAGTKKFHKIHIDKTRNICRVTFSIRHLLDTLNIDPKNMDSYRYEIIAEDQKITLPFKKNNPK